VLFRAAPAVVCRRCGAEADEGRPLLGCRACGGPLDLVHGRDLPRTRVDPGRRGVWRYRPLLPLRDEGGIVTLGEGATPVVDLPRWGAAAGAPRAQAKLEHLAPTGSFKDRGMTLVVSHARELGARALVEDSSGNAGASAAAYAARAGMEATVYAPASAPEAKLRQIAAAGARVVRVPGSRQAVTEAATEAAERGDAYYVGHNVNPYFSFGMTTFAYELVELMGTRLPEHVVMPVGGGSLYVGCWLGLRLWLGQEARLPRLHLAQPSGCAPIVAAQAAGAPEPLPVERRPTVAGGAEIERPARGGQMLAALSDTGGLAVAIEDEAILAERRRMAQLEGIDVEPTAALALAGLVELARRGAVRPDDRTIVVTTGVGLKVPPAEG
jgi:threonine synthase